MFWRKEESHVQRAEGYEEARNELKTVGEKYAAYSGIYPDAEKPETTAVPESVSSVYVPGTASSNPVDPEDTRSTTLFPPLPFAQ